MRVYLHEEILSHRKMLQAFSAVIHIMCFAFSAIEICAAFTPNHFSVADANFSPSHHPIVPNWIWSVDKTQWFARFFSRLTCTRLQRVLRKAFSALDRLLTSATFYVSDEECEMLCNYQKKKLRQACA